MTDPNLRLRRDALYRLLPPIYQTLDEPPVPVDPTAPRPPDGTLKSFLAVIGEQVNLLEDDLARWYDNWFIETCDEWVVPYLGDLVGYTSAVAEVYDADNPEAAVNRAVAYPRREVADTLALRRRKGSLALLEELSRRVVGWPARAVECRTLVAGTAHANRPADPRARTLDLRAGAALRRLGTAFDTLPRSVDVRRISSARTPGRHNLPAVALFAARRKVDSVTLAPTAELLPTEDPFNRAVVRGGPDTRRRFDIQGLDVQLHARREEEPEADTIADYKNLPLPLTRDRLRGDTKPGQVGADEKYYGLGKSVAVVVESGGTARIVPHDEVLVADLKRWGYPQVKADPPGKVVPPYIALDPELGRLVFPQNYATGRVWATFHHGRVAFMGGGEYERGPWKEPVTYVVGEGGTLAETVAAACAHPPASGHAVVEVGDNDIHDATFTAHVPAGVTLEIRAANRYRPCLFADDKKVTTGSVEFCRFTGGRGSTLVLDGLLFGSGAVQIDGDFAEVVIRHCTFTPGRARLLFLANETVVRVARSILGAVVTLEPGGTAPHYREPIRLAVADSILDAAQDSPHACLGSRSIARGMTQAGHVRLSAFRCTALGPIFVRAIDAVEDCLFCGPLVVENPTVGGIRFSHLAAGGVAPPVFHGPPAGIIPRFVSTTYGHPDYARLADDGPNEIAQGAADGGELGAYHAEFFAQRAAHLRTRLQEFIPAGSDAALIFLT